MGYFTWRVSDCEEIEGLLTGDDGVGFRLYWTTIPPVSIAPINPMLKNNIARNTEIIFMIF